MTGLPPLPELTRLRVHRVADGLEVRCSLTFHLVQVVMGWLNMLLLMGVARWMFEVNSVKLVLAGFLAITGYFVLFGILGLTLTYLQRVSLLDQGGLRWALGRRTGTWEGPVEAAPAPLGTGVRLSWGEQRRWLLWPLDITDAQWLAQAISRPPSGPLEAPAESPPSGTGSWVLWMLLSLGTLVCAATWLALLGVPSTLRLSPLFLVWAAIGWTVVLTGLNPRRSHFYLGMFLLGLLAFAIGANAYLDPRASEVAVRVRAVFIINPELGSAATPLMELDVPPAMALWRYTEVAHLKVGSQVVFRVGPGALGQPWALPPEDLRDAEHYRELKNVSLWTDSLGEVLKTGTRPVVQGECAPDSLAAALWKEWGVPVRPRPAE